MEKITTQFADIKILVADDYMVNQEITKEMLEMMGCEADVADDGEDALEMHEKSNYDLIFMDVQMPNMDGYDVTREIRKREGAEQHTIIIAVTANALAGDKQKCIDAGMDDYISKPIKSKNLAEMIQTYVKK